MTVKDYLFYQASQNKIPLGGTFELTPVCNFSCRMCYVRKSRGDMKREGKREAALEDWIRLGRECRDAGMLYLLLMAVIYGVILTKTRTGVYIYAIGSNEEATKLSGINVDKYKTIAYVMCGIGAAMAGLVTMARLGTGEPSAGVGDETMAIAAAAIGGTSLAGGKGSMAGTVLGAFTLSALKIGLIVIGMDTFYQYIAVGLIILVATYIENLQALVMALARKAFKKEK